MGIKDVFNQAPSLEEEALYKQVLDEVESGVMRKGIYAKALADGLGDEGKAQSLYIKYRVQSLIDEEKHKAELLGLKLTAKEKEKKAIKKKLDEKEVQEFWAKTSNSEIWIMGIMSILIIGAVIIWVVTFFDWLL